MLPRLADRISAHPKRVIVAVLAAVVIAGIFGSGVASVMEDSGGFSTDSSGSARAERAIEAATGEEISPDVVLLLETPSGAASPEARRRVEQLSAELAADPGVSDVLSAASGGGRELVSADGRATYLAATLSAEADDDAVAERLDEQFGDQADLTLGGTALSNQALGERIGGDLARAELIAFPILLLLSLLFFRGRAAVLPLVVGISTVFGTFLVLRLVNEAYGLSIFALNLVIGLGLGLAIDYTLFLVSRFREELDRSGPGAGAVRATMATAGRTVVFSATTVAAALITLTVFPLGFLQSMGIAGAVVAVVAALAALIVSPALFAIWGAKLAVRRRGGPEREGAWYRISHAVMRRPVLIAAVTGIAMLAMALPALRAAWTPIDATVIPKDESSRVVADRLAAEFPSENTNPVTIAVAAPRSERPQVEALAADVAGLDGATAVSEPRPLGDSTWQLDVTAEGEAEGTAAQHLVDEVRAVDSPLQVYVAGPAAEFVDQQQAIAERLPLAAGLMALLTFTVLWLMTGSIVLPLKAIVMNALTVGAALGLLTFIYQDGRLEALLGYTSNGGIEPTDFIVAAALVFALSTDYGVFLFGRIKEARDSGASERDAVAIGLQRTGGVVTAAAVLLAVAIGAFSTSSISFIQQVGIATAAGVLVDAFIVRTFLVPSLMALLGRWNWWSPAPLRRLHARLGLDEGSQEQPASAYAMLRQCQSQGTST